MHEVQCSGLWPMQALPALVGFGRVSLLVFLCSGSLLPRMCCLYFAMRALLLLGSAQILNAFSSRCTAAQQPNVFMLDMENLHANYSSSLHDRAKKSSPGTRLRFEDCSLKMRAKDSRSGSQKLLCRMHLSCTPPSPKLCATPRKP